MAHVEPNTMVRLFSGVPLDTAHRNTWYFKSHGEQQQRFLQYLKLTFNAQSYQRAHENAINVESTIDQLLDVNYMAFSNQSHGDKWFYAFVDSVDYVNENCTRVNYHIDNLQTYLFDVDFGACFIEREHVKRDDIINNLVPEPLEVGDFTVMNAQAYRPAGYDSGSAGVLVYYSPKTPKGQIYNSIYAAYSVWGYQLTNDPVGDAQKIDEKINTLIAESNVIVGVTCVPSYMAAVGADGRLSRANYQRDVPLPYALGFPKKDGTTYYPKNMKLYTPQFAKIVVESPSGDRQEYSRVGFLGGDGVSFTFRLVSTAWPVPEQRCYALNYENPIGADPAKYVRYTDFPSLSWSEDSMTAWWAQNGNAFLLSTIANIGFTAAGVAMGNPVLAAAGVSGIASGVSGAANAGSAPASVQGGQQMLQGGGQVDEPKRAKPEPPTGADVVKQAVASMTTLATVSSKPAIVRNGANTGSLSMLNGWFGFFMFYQMGIYGEFAETVDNFLTMFGYQVNAVKKPNIAGGDMCTKFNYLKTNGANVFAKKNSGCPADATADIAHILDTGVTFWTDGVTIGDYTGDNRGA